MGVALAALLTAGAAENPRSAILGTVIDAQSRPLSQSRLLGADRPHVFKAFASKEFTLTLNAGLAYLGAAGTPREADSTRTPWVPTIDAQLSARYGTADQHLVTLSIDAFNVLKAQAVLREETLLPFQYQAPRQLRLGVRYAF
ncbi:MULTISPECIES: TonB-dependent receptor [Myxococcus]|uniref:TonB-dependent receptor n=1 Tax=Myxococcus TaxID=32 RepID=UPI001E29F3E6|nr:MULTISPECIES: TonB-dependent receptor [Myxococcus]